MPYLRKEALSQYIGSACKRQLRLNLSPDTAAYRPERSAQAMPPPQPPRPGLEQFAQQGERWQADKLHDLTQAFGPGAIVGDPYLHHSGQTRYKPVQLEDVLPAARPGQFLIEAQYTVGPACEVALGIAHYPATYRLAYAEVRPDIIEVLPPGHAAMGVTPAGDTKPLPPGDGRRQLRIIDIKLTAEPSPRYFAEVAYYAILLAGWLVDRGLDRDFVVVPDGALWPGSHDAAQLTQENRRLLAEGTTPTDAQLRAALAGDLELVPFDVFAFRVRRFLQEDVPDVLSQPWRDLPWHVDNRCAGCDFLGHRSFDKQGQPTWHDDHCLPMAERQDHLSRIAFMSRGASGVLQEQGVVGVGPLAGRAPADAVFEGHQDLRSMRTVVAGRAAALQTLAPTIPPDSGTSAVMPKWTDLHIYLSADFDQGSAITFAFGLQAFWLEPRPYGAHNPAPRANQAWRAQVFVVDQRDLQAERRELLAFLARINDILREARRAPTTTAQFYLWDTLQYDHLTRAIGRHLPAILADRSLMELAWLFPPEEILPNPTLVTRRSPVTVVRDVVRAVLAAPVPHYYGLLEVARCYHHPTLPPSIAKFSVHPLFEVELSDQIPSERAHEIWTRATAPRHWTTQVATLQETVGKRLAALETVTRRLEMDLALQDAAPPIAIGPPAPANRLSVDGQLWYAFAKLNDALAALEVQQIRAMPPHEREARFHSARLPRRLRGAAEVAALGRLGLRPAPNRRVYALGPSSRQVKARQGDFNFALAPEADPSFLNRALPRVVDGTPLAGAVGPAWGTLMADVTKVTIAAIDPDAGLIALDPDRRWPSALDDLEAHRCADFTTDVTLDPIHHDYFTPKLLAALRAIGNPPSARDDPLVRAALGQPTRRSRPTPHTPPADVLWGAPGLADTGVIRTLPPVRAALEAAGIRLNDTQWRAWEAALSRRLQLIWGPPGTGKSRTAVAIVAGGTLEAQQQDHPLRVLVCASTYNAMDNVLLPSYREVRRLLPGADLEIRRLRSYLQPRDPRVSAAIDLPLNRANPDPAVIALRERLCRRQGITIVGATPEQVHNLLTAANGQAQGELFDLILIDEASQMDVGHAILALCALAGDGAVVLAGDPLQLPPIHPAEPPLGLEEMVGSIYVFCERHHGVSPIMLDENYRSNDTLVEFSLEAGYQTALRSYSPALRLNLMAPLPTTAAPPSGWPTALHWTPEWSALLDPDRPVVCFVYPEGRSSQWNRFEADAVAALIWLLHGRMADQLLGERVPPTGATRPPTSAPYGVPDFWAKAVGVVTPHRAQQGLIVNRLQQLFVGSGVAPSAIREAVDTVERFQGQQRDVIIASFALGDADAIHDEDEFLLSLNRFNVMASRARAKLIVFVSQEVVDHLSHDLDTLRASGLLKRYVESFCRQSSPMRLGVLDGAVLRPVTGLFKSH